MTTHKRVKFPFEVTKGSAKDLCSLKFIRRSELEPNVRHYMKHSVGQMGRQLDIWFKEQIFTIGSLSKEQEKVYESGKRLKKELRRIKKEEYARYQEQVREKLLGIRRKLVLMKVVKKFKDNVEINKQYRLQEMGKRPNIDFLRVPGNDTYMFGTSGSKDEKNGKQQRKPEEHHQKKHKMITSATALSSYNADSAEKERAGSGSSHHTFPEVTNRIESSRYIPESGTVENDEDYYKQQQTFNDNVSMAIFGQNVLPPGSRMATIPEENVDEVEVEMEDLTADDRKLTKKRLSMFNRSRAKRDVFDGSDKVLLLPDLPVARPLLVARSVPPDTEDKETQTSLGSGDKGASKSKHGRGHTRIKKTIVVKLPQSSKRHKRKSKKDDDIRSSTGNYGSDDDIDSDNVNRDTDDEQSSSEIECTTEADAEASDSDGWEGSGENSETTTDVDLTYYENFLISLSHKKSKSSAKSKRSAVSARKESKKATEKSNDNKTAPETPREYKTHFRIIPDDDTFPENSSMFYRQNPRAVQFKERSFYVAPDMIGRPGSGSARYISSRQQDGSFINFIGKTEPETLREIKNRRIGDMNRKLSLEGQNLSREGTNLSTPPNTANSAKPGSRRGGNNSMSVVVINQKRAKASEWKKAHSFASSEPVQKYERTKSGRLLPFGSPRTAKHEVPSMRDQYYRDKLLKAERESILNQNIKMKKFMDTFDRECVHADFSSDAGSPSGRAGHNTASNAGSTSIGNFLFKICEPETDVEFRQKIVPSVSTTSLRTLKNCRYLREYTPLSGQDTIYAKETSWSMDNRRSKYNENYVANVRLQLF